MGKIEIRKTGASAFYDVRAILAKIPNLNCTILGQTFSEQSYDSQIRWEHEHESPASEHESSGWKHNNPSENVADSHIWSEHMKIALCVLRTFEIPENKVFDALQAFRP